MTVLTDCRQLLERLTPYLENALPGDERRSVEDHLRGCAACRKELEKYRKIQGALRGAFPGRALSENFDETTGRKLNSVQPCMVEDEEPVLTAPQSSWLDQTGAAPWWAVSVSLHVLAILLASLVTMTIGEILDSDEVIVVTNIEKTPLAQAEEEKKEKPALRDILESKMDVQATDPTSTEQSKIVVPPDILAKAELGDHFETINPDRPDTQSAFGNPDAKMFHSVEGNSEPEGGGGASGLSLMDELIGVGGSASPGTGGGWGGGNGTGTGVGTGSGHGSFGARNGGGRKLMVMKHGGTKATESAVDKALEWLAKHQEADGHWDGAKYGTAKTCDTALAGFALLAFLGAGHTEKVGKYRDNVSRGIEWLIKKQADNGCLASKGESIGYNHSIAGMALAEAAGMGRTSFTKEAAQKALEYSVNIHQAGEGSDKKGWRYKAQSAIGDLSNSGWFVMQLKSGKVAGLKVPHGGFEGAEWFLNHVEDKAFAKDAQDPYDNGRHRYGYTGGNEVTARRTAIGILCRQFMGVKPEELQGGVNWFVEKGGIPRKEKIELYYWYYGTLCTFQQGGDIWKKWNEALKPALLETQCKGGDNDGSWDPAEKYGTDWGRVGQTALSAMCLEVYYRYLPMYR